MTQRSKSCNVPHQRPPGAGARTDIANVYGSPLPRHSFSEVIADPVEQGVMLDADCVVVNLLTLPDQPEIHQACVQNINHLKCKYDLSGMQVLPGGGGKVPDDVILTRTKHLIDQSAKGIVYGRSVIHHHAPRA